MPLCCVDIAIGARVVAVIGLLAASIVVMEMSTELATGRGDGGVAVLLGLSADELDSRQRHAPHSKHHDELAVSATPWEYWGSPDPAPQDRPTLTSFERNVFAGFLVFAVLYAVSSALLAYASIVMLKWGAIPWLILQVLSIASQSARLVVQVSQLEHSLSEPRHHTLLNAPPMSAHPVPRGVSWEQHMKEHHGPQHEQQQASSVVHIALSAVHLAVSVYMWLVVLVAHREWLATKKPRRRVPALGDEGFSLSLTNLNAVKQPLSSTPLKS